MQYRKSEIGFPLFDKNFTGIGVITRRPIELLVWPNYILWSQDLYPLKSQTDLTDLYLGKRFAFFDRIIEIDAAKVRAYESYMISLAILILGHCQYMDIVIFIITCCMPETNVANCQKNICIGIEKSDCHGGGGLTIFLVFFLWYEKYIHMHLHVMQNSQTHTAYF